MTPLRFSVVLAAALLALAGCTPETGGGEDNSRTFHADPSSIDFGYVQASGSSDPVTIALVNGTSREVEIESIRMSDGADVFSFFNLPTTLPVTIDDDAELEIAVYFAPLDADVYLGTVEILTGDETYDTLEVDLGGCSTAVDCTVDVGDDDDAADDDDDATDDDDGAGDGQISVDPASVDFGQVPQNTSPVQRVLRLQNVGDDVLHVSGVTIEGGDSLFQVGGYSGGNVQPGVAPIEIQVQFSPVGASMGQHTATLRIESDSATSSNLSINLSAEVIEDCGDCLPVLEVVGGVSNPNVIGIGPDPLIYKGGLTTGTNNVVIRNAGYGTLNVSQITEGLIALPLPPNDGVNYTGGDPLPFALGAGDEATLQITVTTGGCEWINFDGQSMFIVGAPATAEECIAL